MFHSKTRGFFHQPPQLAGSAAAPPAPPPAPPELTLFTLNLTGKVSLVSVKKGRLLTKSGIFDSSLGQKGETTNTQTSVGKQYGLVLFTEIFLNHRPSGIWGSYVDNPPLKPSTIHTRGCFPGRSPLPTGDRPRWDLFSRTVAPSNRGPSTLGAIIPEGHPFQLGTVHTGTCFPGRSPLPTGDRPRWEPFSRTVAPSNRGPSTLGPVFPDGHLSKPGTVHSRGRFPGRSTFGAGRDGARRHATPS